MNRRLSYQEKLVLFALTEDANRTDAEIGERIGMKQAAVGRHRRSLVKDGHVHLANLPSFHRLGLEFVVQIFGHINIALPWDRKTEIFNDWFKNCPSIFEATFSEGFLLSSGVFQNIADFLTFQERFRIFFENLKGPRGELFRYAFFPFDISRFSFGNFAPSMSRILKIDLQTPPMCKPLIRMKRETTSLSPSETKILIALTEFPELNDEGIAHRVNKSRQSVTEIRNRFVEDGLITRIAFPTFISEDFGALAYVHAIFDPDTTLERKVSVAGDSWWMQSIYTLERNSEVFAIYPFGSFKEYSDLIETYLGPFQESRLLLGEPEQFVGPPENIDDIIYCSFAPLVRQVLQDRLSIIRQSQDPVKFRMR